MTFGGQKKGRVGKDTAVLILILLLGGALRFIGIGFGLPNLQCRPDEEMIVFEALNFFKGDLNPHNFQYPTLFMYILFGLYILYFLAEFALRSSVTGFMTQIALDPSHFFLMARGLSALFGSLTVLAVYFLCKRLTDRRTALVASFFMSVVYLHVRDSHFGTTDVTMSFFICCTVYFILKIFDEARRNDYILAGVFTGLASGTKYAGVFLCLPMFLAQLLRNMEKNPEIKRQAKDDNASPIDSPATERLFRGLLRQGIETFFERRLWLFGLMAAVTFFICTPFALIDFQTFYQDFRFETAHLHKGHEGLILGRGWGYHLRYTLFNGLGWSLLVCALIGIPLVVRRNTRKALIVFSFPVFYYVFVGRGYTVFFRYMIPLIPFLVFAAAVFVTSLVDQVSRRIRGGFLLPLLCLAVAFPSISNDIQFLRNVLQEDNRLIAAEWILKEIPSGTSIYQSGFKYGHVQLPQMIESLNKEYEEILRRGDRGGLLKIRIDHVEKGGVHGGYALRDWQDGELSQDTVDLPDCIILQESPLKIWSRHKTGLPALLHDRYRLIKSFLSTDGKQERNWYDQLDAFYLPFIGFDGVVRPGPNLYVYLRKDVVFDSP